MIIQQKNVNGIMTKTNLPVGDYAANPYIGCTHACKYCYACFMKRFTGHTEPWGEFLDVKYWAEIKNPEKYSGRSLFMGSVTDPYLPEEAQYKRTQALLEQLKDSGIQLSIATKSDLVLRDIDLIRRFSNPQVSWSINTVDEQFRSDMDNAVSIKRRFDAMKIFHDAGIRTTCFISPIFPGITRVKDIIHEAKGKCNLVWLENLNLRGTFKAQIMQYIEQKYANLVPLYRDIYTLSKRDYWEYLDIELRAFAKEEGFEYLVNDANLDRPFSAPPAIINYFYHSEIKRSAKPRSSARMQNE